MSICEKALGAALGKLLAKEVVHPVRPARDTNLTFKVLPGGCLWDSLPWISAQYNKAFLIHQGEKPKLIDPSVICLILNSAI